MVLLNDQHSKPPSWFVPMVVGAAFALLSTAFALVILPLLPDAVHLVGSCCCVPLAFVPQGIVPAWFAFRRDESLTPGNGFVVSFIAVGLGLVLIAGLFAMTFDPVGAEQMMHDLFRQRPELVSGMSDSEIDDVVRVAVVATPCGALLLAAGSTLLAAFVGMATVLVMRPKPGAVPPQVPPAQSPSDYLS